MNTTIQLKIAATLTALGLFVLGACSSAPLPTPGKVIQSQRSGDLIIDFQNEKGELAQGQNAFTLTFRSASKNQAVDVGTVSVGSSMAMPGMAPMTASIELQPSGKTGEYSGKGDFAMSGAWRFEVRWDGPAGQGSTSFNSNVR